MRALGIIVIGLLVFASCKTASVTTTSPTEYSEDLSNLRPDLAIEEEKTEQPEINEVEEVVFENHLKTELDSINKLIIAKNQQQNYVDGYTIQLYTGLNRNEADAAMEKAKNLDPTFEPKFSYPSPNFRVVLGQFTNRLKAHEVFTFIQKEFPRALLIPERIKVDYE